MVDITIPSCFCCKIVGGKLFKILLLVPTLGKEYPPFCSFSCGPMGQLQRKEERYWKTKMVRKENVGFAQCLSIETIFSTNGGRTYQITRAQALICNPKMLGFRPSWLPKES